MSKFYFVLILIVVDNGLVHRLAPLFSGNRIVLILIVVDNGLVRNGNEDKANNIISLNPYCSGQWTSTYDLVER